MHLKQSSNNSYPISLLFTMTSLLTNIYATTGLTLFVILCRLIADLYNAICVEVDQMSVDNFPTAEMFSVELKKLQNKHFLVWRCVDELNRCFGFLLLLDIVFKFVGVINSTMYIFITFISAEKIWQPLMVSIIFFVYHIISLTLICCSSDTISIKVLFSCCIDAVLGTYNFCLFFIWRQISYYLLFVVCQWKLVAFLQTKK